MVSFKSHLNRQLRFIERSANLYDQGFEDEATRIATALRILFHRTSASTPLVDHLGIRDVQLLSTNAPPRPGCIMQFHYGLTGLRLGGNQGKPAPFLPKLDQVRAARLLPLPEWWEGDIVYRRVDDSGAVDVTRRDIVLGAANQDGGAHVDPDLRPKYRDLDQGFGVVTVTTKGDTRLAQMPVGAHYAAIRQMAFEVLRSRHLIGVLDPSVLERAAS